MINAIEEQLIFQDSMFNSPMPKHLLPGQIWVVVDARYDEYRRFLLIKDNGVQLYGILMKKDKEGRLITDTCILTTIHIECLVEKVVTLPVYETEDTVNAIDKLLYILNGGLK